MGVVRTCLVAGVVALLPLVPGAARAGGGPAVGGGGVAPVAGGAGAAVQVGAPTVPGYHIGFEAFYPRMVSVHQGDVVTFKWAGNNPEIHNVVLLPTADPRIGRSLLSKLIPPHFLAPDRDDARALLLPFNGNILRGCGTSAYYPSSAPCSFDGTSVINSGAEFGQNYVTGANTGARYSIQANARPGKYLYICLVHGPVMSGILSVLPKSAPIATRAAEAQDARQSHARHVAQAFQAVSAANHQVTSQIQGSHAVWTALAGSSSPEGPPTSGDADLDQFFPRALVIKAGDTVRWKFDGHHSVTFPATAQIPPLKFNCEAAGSRDITVGLTGLSRCGAGTESEASLAAELPSGPPGRPYTGGFYNSGSGHGPNASWSVAFPKPGVYHYVCLFHRGMNGTIVVR